MAFGMGFGMSQRTNLIAVAVPTSEIGVASSVLALARNIAGAFGIAIFGTILDNSADSHLLNIAKNSFSSSLSQGLVNAHEYATAVGLMELKAQVDAYSTVFVIAATIILIGGFFAFFIKVDANKLTHEHEVTVE